jgi:hypothetical protein
MTKIAAELLIDLLGIIGAGLIAYGAGSVFEPAGYIVGGAFLIVAAAVLARPRT